MDDPMVPSTELVLEFQDYETDHDGSYKNDFKNIFNNARIHGRKMLGGQDDYDEDVDVNDFQEVDNDDSIDQEDEFPDIDDEYQVGGNTNFGNGVEINDAGDLDFEPTAYNNNQQGYEYRKQMLLKRTAMKMVGGKKQLPPAMTKMIELSTIIRSSGPHPKGVNLLGVAKVIWDDAISKLGGNSSDINKIMAIATKSAAEPQIFIDKYQKMAGIGESILKSGTYKAVGKMDVGKLVWEEATKQSRSGASLNEIERIAKSLAEKNPKSWVDQFKANKAAKAASKK